MRLYFFIYVQSCEDIIKWFASKGEAVNEYNITKKHGYFPTPVTAFDVPDNKAEMINFLKNFPEHFVEKYY